MPLGGSYDRPSAHPEVQASPSRSAFAVHQLVSFSEPLNAARVQGEVARERWRQASVRRGVAKEEANMLGNTDAVANLAVRNLTTARQFYEETLGLEPIVEDGDELVTYKSGSTVVNVYRSRYAGTNQATAVTWNVDDIDGVVRELRDKGVSFEHYDMPGMSLKGDIHVASGMKVAWFKDPDGNILNVVEM